jgi:hypothetical protein
MQKLYIGVKQVSAEPMTLGEYNKVRGWTIPENEDPDSKGYKIEYYDQSPPHVTWSPKEVFERAYLPLTDPKGSKITIDDIKTFCTTVHSAKIGRKTTLLHINTQSGFSQFETSACVDPENYDHSCGVDACMDRIYDRLWYAMGFVLQWARFGLDPLRKDNDTDEDIETLNTTNRVNIPEKRAE